MKYLTIMVVIQSIVADRSSL